MAKSGSLPIFLDLFSQIGKSALMAIPQVRNRRLRSPRTSNLGGDIGEYLQSTAYRGVDMLLETGSIAGKSICEIGPGDNLSSGLSMLGAGAARYAAIDRFPGNYTSEAAKAIYKETAAHWASFHPSIPWDPSVDAAIFPEAFNDRVTLIDKPIESAGIEEEFDIVCSFQVGEHVSDINVFAGAHTTLLKPDGFAVHRVDFGPHDVWSTYSDPTTFLRFPELLWKMTGSNRGIPNRRRHNEFLDAFRNAGINVEVLLVEHFDEEAVEYSKLNKRFLSMPKESVLVKTAIYKLTRN